MPGVSIAVMRNKRLVYAAGFGVADKNSGLPMSPRHRLRVASVSKPFTHVAVLKLLADTDLDSSTKVFGSNTILGKTWSTPSGNPDIEDITIDHLIRHRAGFRRIDKDGKNSDPMFDYTGTTHAGLIEWALENYPLGYTPGTTPAGLDGSDMYSNFGYCLLGRVIEARSGWLLWIGASGQTLSAALYVHRSGLSPRYGSIHWSSKRALWAAKAMIGDSANCLVRISVIAAGHGMAPATSASTI